MSGLDNIWPSSVNNYSSWFSATPSGDMSDQEWPIKYFMNGRYPYFSEPWSSSNTVLSQPSVCPSCGHCPTCGRTAASPYFPQGYPQWTPTVTETTNVKTENPLDQDKKDPRSSVEQSAGDCGKACCRSGE